MSWRILNAVALVILTIACIALPWLWDFLLPLEIVGTVMALYLITRTGILSSLWVTWIWGSCAIAVAFHWSPAAMAYSLSSSYWLGLIVSIPLILWDGMRLALGFWLASKITQDIRWIWIPVACITVLLETCLPSVFPWKLGLPFLHAPWIVQGIDVFGSSWTTVIDLLVAGTLISLTCFVMDFRQRQRLELRRILNPSFLVPIIAMALNAAYCFLSWTTLTREVATAPHIKIGMVQVDPGYVESLGEMQNLSLEAGTDVDLICWPESSGGTLDMSLCDLSDKEVTFQKSKEPLRGIRPWPNPHCELLLGGKNYLKRGESGEEILHVTAMLIDESERITGRYHKRQLMPFGEYVPLGKWFPALEKLFEMQDIIEPGVGSNVIVTQNGAKLGTFLCYEDMIPDSAVDLVRCDANLLVSLINGSAFESPFTLQQHRLLAQSRAIETRRFFVRCAATGETCIISPLGVVESRIPLTTKGVLVGNVALLDRMTIFASFPRVLPILVAACILLFWFSSRRRRTEASERTG
jgi:apolipoprotein N-acyltransferase